MTFARFAVVLAASDTCIRLKILFHALLVFVSTAAVLVSAAPLPVPDAEPSASSIGLSYPPSLTRFSTVRTPMQPHVLPIDEAIPSTFSTGSWLHTSCSSKRTRSPDPHFSIPLASRSSHSSLSLSLFASLSPVSHFSVHSSFNKPSIAEHTNPLTLQPATRFVFRPLRNCIIAFLFTIYLDARLLELTLLRLSLSSGTFGISWSEILSNIQ